MIHALETLKGYANWVCWTAVKRDTGKTAKLPKNPFSGGNASPTNEATWSDFMTAVRAKKQYNLDGLGWVFTEPVGIVGIDLDGCIDAGEVAPWAKKIVSVVNSYTEVSPSGHGLHIFAYGRIPKALGPVPGGKIEMYARDRYFTITGNMLPGASDRIADSHEAVDNLWRVVTAKRDKRDRAAGGFIEHPKNTRLSHDAARYAAAALQREITHLVSVSEGCRNNQLNLASYRLGQFVAVGLLDRAIVESALFSTANRIGLGEAESIKTIASGINGGIRKPRQRWPSGLFSAFDV